MRTTSVSTGEPADDILGIVKPVTSISKRKPPRRERVRGGKSTPIRIGKGTAARVSALIRRPDLAAIARSASSRGASAWIVGGAARDLLLGRDVVDVDAAASGDPFPIALDLQNAGFGTRVLLSESAPRVARVAGKREIDIAELEGESIDEDLGRRDFTVNAMAISLSTGAWTDPFGGMRDLAAARLRLISERNLAEDPLRALRGARLIATHRLSPDLRTTAACRRVAPLLSTAAPERIRLELVKLLGAPRALPALRWAARAGLLGPAIGRPVSRAEALALLRRARIDAPLLGTVPPEDRARLRLAALAKALGMDAEAAAGWLVSRRFSRADAGGVSRLLRLENEARTAADESARWRWVRDAGLLWGDALRFAALSGVPSVTRRALASRARRARRPPRVDGTDVLRWLAIPPGPRVGELLRAVETEGLRGAVRTRAQARRWLLAAANSVQERAARREGAPAGYNSST